MSNYNSYDVAVMNYPLFNKRIQTTDCKDRIFLGNGTRAYGVPIYVHIPFCDSICDFCIYNRVLAKEHSEIVEAYVNSLLLEIDEYAKTDYIKNQKIESVFIGGGTPTVLNENQLERLIRCLREKFDLNNCEFTVECNPANASLSKMKLLKDLGVTRVSTGVQTFDDSQRERLHVQKTSKEVMQWLAKMKTYGFDAVSTDLIYGFPGTTSKDVIKNIDQALRLNLDHISVYKLSIFAYTKLYRDCMKDNIVILSEDSLYDMFLQTHRYLLDHSFTLSSSQEYGKPNRSVRFWDNTYDGYGDNLSFGMSSFGYVNGYCYQNSTTVKKYINRIQSGQLPIEFISDQITEEQLKERALVMGFRRGYVKKQLFEDAFHQRMDEVFKEPIDKMIQMGYVTEEGDCYRLTEQGIYKQGTVSSEFMISIFRGVTALKKKLCIGAHEMP